MLYKDYKSQNKAGNPDNVVMQLIYYEGKVSERFSKNIIGNLVLNLGENADLTEELIMPDGFKLSCLLEELIFVELIDRGHILTDDSDVTVKIESSTMCSIYLANIDAKNDSTEINILRDAICGGLEIPDYIIDIVKYNLVSYFKWIEVNLG